MGGARRGWWWISAGFLVFITLPAGWGIAVLRRAHACSPGCEPGSYRAAAAPRHLRSGWPSGWPRASGARETRPAPRGWSPTTAARLGNTVGKGVDLHSAATGHRHAHAGPPLFDRTRGRPDPGTGSTVTSSTSARSPSATTPPSARAPRCFPGRWSARTPTSPPVRAWSARCERTASTGRDRPRRSPVRPRHPVAAERVPAARARCGRRSAA